MTPKILIITGPTASGKKLLAMKAASLFNGEIVSADSRKVYRYFDIGTAKPSPEDRKAVTHHVIDVVEPDEPFSAGEWLRLASGAVSGILARGKLPVITGGTGFYIDAFQNGLTESIASDPAVRKRLEDELSEKGTGYLYDKLLSIDPDRAVEIHKNDVFRLTRALEVYYITGRTFSSMRSDPRLSGGDYEYFYLGVHIERNVLYRRIEERIDRMISAGLVEEFQDIINRGYARNLMAFDTVGYKELFPYLDGMEPLEGCIDTIKRNTKRYAKRQNTWFRARQGISWVDGLNEEEVSQTLKMICQWIEGKKK